MTLRDTIHMKI